MRQCWQVGVSLLGLLWISGCTLAGDITPPPALATAQSARPLPPTPVSGLQDLRLQPPQGPADLVAGGAIYAQECADCHGEAGLGDGELASELGYPPSPLGDPDFARRSAPADWYTVVTLGNIERLMPGFASLADQERWDVVGYALSLGVATDRLRRGEELFEATCAGCHTGQGPGKNFGTGRLLVERSAEQIYQAISQGVGDEMPDFSEALSSEDRWSLALFIQKRDLTAGVSQPEPIADASVDQTPTGKVIGTIRNGTAGSPVPANMEVTLRTFEGDQEMASMTSLSDSAGRFTFEGLEAFPGRLYMASVEYQSVPYVSEPAHLLPDQSTLELSLTIYEPTSDTGPLRVQRVHLLFDFSIEGVARVLELWALSNPTDRIMVNPEGVVQISLPKGAANLQFEEGNAPGRYLLREGGFADASPLEPGLGTSDLVFGFDMPFEGRLDFDQPIDHRVQAVVILMPPDGPRLKGEGVQDLGVQDMGGITMHNYALGALAPEDTLSFQLSWGLAASLGALQLPSLLVGAGALGMALVLTGLWWFRGTDRLGQIEPRGEPRIGLESLLREIARLDDDFGLGKLNESDYRRQRESLKRRALERMRAGDD